MLNRKTVLAFLLTTFVACAPASAYKRVFPPCTLSPDTVHHIPPCNSNTYHKAQAFKHGTATPDQIKVERWCTDNNECVTKRTLYFDKPE